MNKILLVAVYGLFLCFCLENAHSQTVITIAGNGIDSLVDGNALNASFGKCFGITSDDEGNIYIPDTYHNCIRKVDPQGNVSTFAGSGSYGNTDAAAKNATFSEPAGACIDHEGNLFIADWDGNKIRKIDTNGDVHTIAGIDSSGYKNGRVEEAMFCAPRSCCVDHKGDIYVGDCWNHCIRKITSDGMVSTLAGGGQPYVYFNDGGWKDGNGLEARFNAPCGLDVDQYGNIYVADANNNRIRKISPEGVVCTIAGSVDAEGNSAGFKDGHIDSAQLSVPTELIVDDDGCIFIADTYNNCIRLLSPDGFLTTIAGNGEKGYKDGAQSICDSPRGLALVHGDLYFFDYYNHRLRCVQNPKAQMLKNNAAE